MIYTSITHVPVDNLVFTREARQRSDLTPESVLPLALSIAEHQWISPILVEKSTHLLVAGERRTTAVKLLRQAVEDPSGLSGLPEAELQRLLSICACKQSAWENWTKIPAQLGSNLTPTDLLVYEFIENKEREDLSWQDRAKAVYEIHAKCLAESKEVWDGQKTAKLLGLSVTIISRSLKVQRARLSNNPALAQIVAESSTLMAATAALERYESRRQSPLTLNPQPVVVRRPSPVDKKQDQKENPELSPEALEVLEEIPLEVPQTLGEQLILQGDFHQFAQTYEGPPFNFIHLDFPYGIEFNRAVGQGTAADTKLAGGYDDSEDVYWELLTTLAAHQYRLIAPSAHVMFWYSQNLEDETKQFFRNRFPAAVLQKFKMIWHCSDNSGLMPDPQRYGRRTYETAFLLSFGDRKIVKGKALSFANPRENSLHRSQKPLAVLSHFFEMFVDDSSRVADFTCGSGTSVVAAYKAGAKSVLGLELNEEMRRTAVRYVNQMVR